MPISESENSSDYDSKRQTYHESQGTRPNQSSVMGGLRMIRESEDSHLPYDYLSLYSLAKDGIVDGRKARLPTKAKYFLPMLITRLYLIGVLGSVMQDAALAYFIICILLEVLWLIYLIVVRPFISHFTNFRIIICSLILLVAEVCFTIYLYNASNGDYQVKYEEITTYILVVLVGTAFVLYTLQHIWVWKT